MVRPNVSQNAPELDQYSQGFRIGVIACRSAGAVIRIYGLRRLKRAMGSYKREQPGA